VHCLICTHDARGRAAYISGNAHLPVLQLLHVNGAHGNVDQKIVTLITATLIPMVTTQLLMVISTLFLEAVNMFWQNHVTMMTLL